jgi:hypothetical protein
MLAHVMSIRLVATVYKILTVSGVVVEILLVRMSETLVLCLNTLAHVVIISIADLVSTISTKDVFGVKIKDPESAKNLMLHALLH